MKLVLAIINNDDSVKVSADLNREGFFVTRLSTTGGFLMVGNTTLLIGTDDEDIPRLKEILAKSCAKRKHVNATTSSLGRGLNDNNGLPEEVTVGGATIFVMSVDEMSKI